MLTAVIVAHPKRITWAEQLAAEVGGTIVLDEDGLGAGANHRRALEVGIATRAEHLLVLEDDALPVPGLLGHVEAAIEHRPGGDGLIGLYVGRQRPRAKQVSAAVIEAEMTGASWLTFTGLLWGVATVWPRALAEAWLAEPLASTWDQQARRWCKTHGHDVAYTWPSLVDHRDEEPVVVGRRDRQAGRVAHRVGIPTWSDLVVTIA